MKRGQKRRKKSTKPSKSVRPRAAKPRRAASTSPPASVSAAIARSVAVAGSLPAPVPITASVPVAAEGELLRLAREVAEAIRGPASTSPIRAALETIARAYEPGKPLPRALVEAWPDPAPLGIAWAQEQVRLAVEDALTQEVLRGHARDDLPLGTLAWLFCAACAATAYESAGAVSERLDALMALIEPSARPPRSRGDGRHAD